MHSRYRSHWTLQTGRTLTKGTAQLLVYRCARGSLSLERFDLPFNRVILEATASPFISKPTCSRVWAIGMNFEGKRPSTSPQTSYKHSTRVCVTLSTLNDNKYSAESATKISSRLKSIPETSLAWNISCFSKEQAVQNLLAELDIAVSCQAAYLS